MITKYELMIDRSENHHPYLVQEAAIDYAGESFTSPCQIVEMLTSCFHMDILAEERMLMLVMDSAGQPLGVFELSRGTVRETMVGVRELVIRVLLCGGVSFVLAHNHPSGNTQPSKEDRQVCKKIKEAATLMDVVMLDFIIIGDDRYLSFSRENLL